MKNIAVLAALILTMAWSQLTHAVEKTYPNRTIRMVVPFAVGGPNDAVARKIAMAMNKHLGQAIQVENRAGVGGIMGTESVVKAEADGYTLLAQSVSLATLTSTEKNLSFDPAKDLKFVGQFASMPMILLARPTFNASNLPQLVKQANLNQPYLIANSGPGSPSYLCGRMLAKELKIDMTQVPYKGNAPSIVDLIAGRVDLLCAQTSIALPLIQNGQVKALGISSKRRSNLLPDLPTFGEQGHSALEINMWHGIFAPKNTPDHVVETLAQALQLAITDEEFVKYMQDSGGLTATVTQATPRQFKQDYDKETRKWQKYLDVK